MSTAFVLGGGGVLGAVEVGMLRALLERGIRTLIYVGATDYICNWVRIPPSSESGGREVDTHPYLCDTDGK